MSAAKKSKTTRRIHAAADLIPMPPMNFSGSSSFIADTEKSIITSLNASISSIISNTAKPTYQNTTQAFSNALSIASLLSSQCTLPALVGSDAAARERSSESKKTFRFVFSSLFSNREMYEKLSAPVLDMTLSQTKFNQELRNKFERKGVGLSSEEDRAKVAVLSNAIGQLEADFEQNINEDTSNLLLSEEELIGCTASFIASLELTTDGTKRRILTMKAPHSGPVMKHCTNETTRKKLQFKSQTRCASNEAMLMELVAKRQERAQLLGWKDHATFMLNVKMAENTETVMNFMENISNKLTTLRNEDLTGKYSKRRRSNVAVIIVRIVFISSFLFYCLLLNHSFSTNPNKITNCFKLFSLLQLTTTLLLRRFLTILRMKILNKKEIKKVKKIKEGVQIFQEKK